MASRSRTAARTLPWLAISLAIASCGSGGGPAEQGAASDHAARAEIRAAYARYAEAIYNADYGKACVGLDRSALRALGGRDKCGQELATLFGHAPPPGARPTLSAITIDESRARARASTPGGSPPSTVRFAKHEGDWKITADP